MAHTSLEPSPNASSGQHQFASSPQIGTPREVCFAGRAALNLRQIARTPGKSIASVLRVHSPTHQVTPSQWVSASEFPPRHSLAARAALAHSTSAPIGGLTLYRCPFRRQAPRRAKSRGRAVKRTREDSPIMTHWSCSRRRWSSRSDPCRSCSPRPRGRSSRPIPRRWWGRSECVTLTRFPRSREGRRRRPPSRRSRSPSSSRCPTRIARGGTRQALGGEPAVVRVGSPSARVPDEFVAMTSVGSHSRAQFTPSPK